MKHERLPISGNIDATVVREICKLHGVSSKVEKNAKGGEALGGIVKKRNSLAHGDESFEEVGRQFVAADLVLKKQEIVLYMRGILRNLEKFAKSKKYKRVP